MPKITPDTPQILAIEGTEYTIPEDCSITLNLSAIHYSATHWGLDYLAWRPSRHIKQDGFITPAQGTLVAWAGGPRVCPGKKFAQVEFVATIALVLKKHRVSAVTLDGESREDTRKRVMETVADSDVGVSPTLKMLHPERVKLRWEDVKS